MSLYTYSEGDLWSNPNTYMYTTYHGERFLDDYKRSRLEALNFFLMKLNLPEAQVEATGTEKLIEEILKNRDREKLEKIIGKVERLKRLSEGYSSDLKKRKGSYRVFRIYAQAAVCIASYVKNPSDLKELNALLKINDILVAHKKNCSGGLQAKCCVTAIEIELRFTDILRESIEY